MDISCKPPVIVLHGGPGAPGDAAGLARGLEDGFRVWEPYQRRSGGEPLSVAIHVEDLRQLILSLGERPALVGHSWGAMLALVFAARYPELASALVLVGCGTFDEASRAVFRARWEPAPFPADFDARGYQETWDDMLRLQREAVYPAAFAAIRAPVLMLHGADDPHPGRMILGSLKPHLPQVEYKEWARCGHYPWREKAVCGEFFATLRGWLLKSAA